MPKMKLSDYVVDEIAKRTGARHVFMLSGGMAMHLVESFGSHPSFSVIPTHHEQAAGIAASAYARVREVPGVVLITAGPGALNAVTPCAGAWMESVPMVFVSGQVSRANSRQGHPLRQRGIQEAEIVDVVKSITKYAVKIDDPLTIREHLERGLRLAVEGRPGPVWFDIPVDVQAAEIDPSELAGDDSPSMNKGTASPPAAEFDHILRDLCAAKRPLIILGHGIRLSGAADTARRLVEALEIPFQTSWNGMDLVGDDHPLFAGRANVFGSRYANLIIQNADYVLSIGARLGIQHTGYNVEAFCRGARLVMVDIDEAETLKPGLLADERIIADAGVFIRGLLDSVARNVKPGPRPEWETYCKEVKRRFPPAATFAEVQGLKYVDPKYFIDRLSAAMPDNAVFPFGSSGQGHTMIGGLFNCKPGQRVFTFKGLAAMGYGLPCAVGACVAAPDQPVFTLVGEGGLQLNLHELQTIKHNGLKAKIIVFNNGGYHSIHMTQGNFFKGHFVGSGPESGVSFPSLRGLADLYGLGYFSVESNENLEQVLADFVTCPSAAFLEVMIDPQRAVEPKLASMKLEDGSMVSRPLDDMAPFIETEELQKYLEIPLMR
jgi:Thiamine pyrophosphate-requiring enzymes [acetolactate synthase, pyruvate dehydrogenase (cytochrome), glyoxylate carboligase, phosphonopyruvate decarboxylase]